MNLSIRSGLLAAVLATSAMGLTGCVQMPTENHSVVDQRPQISFQLANESQAAARVLVDRLDMGAVGDYSAGKSALRVLPGSHVIEVRLGNQQLLNERLYIADGVARTLRLN